MAGDWWQRMACQGAYLTPPGDPARPLPVPEDTARQVCVSCPVRAACLAERLAGPSGRGWAAGFGPERLNPARASLRRKFPSRPIPSEYALGYAEAMIAAYPAGRGRAVRS
jgi:hypothetical protein